MPLLARPSTKEPTMPRYTMPAQVNALAWVYALEASANARKEAK